MGVEITKRKTHSERRTSNQLSLDSCHGAMDVMKHDNEQHARRPWSAMWLNLPKYMPAWCLLSLTLTHILPPTYGALKFPPTPSSVVASLRLCAQMACIHMVSSVRCGMCQLQQLLVLVWASAVADYLIYVLFLSVSFWWGENTTKARAALNILSSDDMDAIVCSRREEGDYDCKFLFVLYESSLKMMLIMMMVWETFSMILARHHRGRSPREKVSKLSQIFKLPISFFSFA